MQMGIATLGEDLNDDVLEILYRKESPLPTGTSIHRCKFQE